MASLYSTSSVLSSSHAASGILALPHDRLRCRRNPVLRLKLAPLNCKVGKRVTPTLPGSSASLVPKAGVVGPKPRVILIAGPTGVGKTRLSIELAKALNGEIINTDSVQVYQGLQGMGAAKAKVQDWQGIPHHFMDVVPPMPDSPSCGCSEFHMLAARTVTNQIVAKGKVPIVVGGTGIHMRRYMHSPAQHLCQPGEPQFLDSASSWDYDFQCYFLYQHRADLYPRVDLRCEQMVPALLAETSWLMDLGVSHEEPWAIGFDEALRLLLHARKNDGWMSEQIFMQFVSKFQENSKNLVRKQIEWFQSEPSAVRQFKWLAADASSASTATMVEILTEEYGRAPGTVSTMAMGHDLRNHSASVLEQGRLQHYQPALEVYSDPAALANTLAWIYNSYTRATFAN